MKKSAALLFIVLILASCSQKPTGPNIEALLESGQVILQIIQGNNQVATVTDTLPKPCIVEARESTGTDELGPLLPGVLINFVVTEGEGSVFAGSAITDSDGRAADIWILGTVAGTQRMEARAVKSDGTPVIYDTFKSTAEPGPPDIIQVADPPGGTSWGMFIREELDLSEVVQVFDKYGNSIQFQIQGDPAFNIQGTVLAPTGIVFGSIAVIVEDSIVTKIGLGSFLDPRELGLIGKWKHRGPANTEHGIRDSMYVRMEKVPGTWRITPKNYGLVWIANNVRSMVSQEKWTRVSWYRNGNIDTTYSEDSSIQFQSIAPLTSLNPDILRWSGSDAKPIRISEKTWEQLPPHPYSNNSNPSSFLVTAIIPPF